MAKTKNKNKKFRYQDVYDRPQYKLVGKILTKKGQRLLDNKEISKEEAYEKYGRNKYKLDPEAVYLKTIRHRM